MRIHRRQFIATVSLSILLALSGAVSLLRADTGTCSGVNLTLPFLDVAGNQFFCQIAEAYFAGLTSGTSATTYSPQDTVTRGQMAAFITRTLDQSLKRGSRRAALKQFWSPQNPIDLPLTTVGDYPRGVACDGADVWVANYGIGGNGGSVSRVRASDGKLLETWTGADGAVRVLVAKGRIYAIGNPGFKGKLYSFDPTQPAGPVTTLNVNFGGLVRDLAFDGDRLWITDGAAGIYLLSFGPACNPCATQLTTGLLEPVGLVYDGANMWVTDQGDKKLKKLDANGTVIQSVPVGDYPLIPVFDGTNIWVPYANAITVVRASNGAVVATLTDNGLDHPYDGAFDGERVLFTNGGSSFGTTVSLWKATDLSPLGSVHVSDGTVDASGVCSDGLNFWIALNKVHKLARF